MKKKSHSEQDVRKPDFFYDADVKVEKKYEDMSWEELQEGIELLRLVEEFERKYGETPELKQFGPFITGMKKLKRWKHDFNIFCEGVKTGSKWAKEWIEKKFEEEMEKETG